MITLRIQTLVDAPIARCFDLARSADLHADSACLIHGKATAGRLTGLSQPGDWTTWSARFFGLRFSLCTQIIDFEQPHRFSDVLQKGLFAHFGHRYTFQSIDESRTAMTDEFFFQSPCGALGAVFDRLVLRGRMQAVLDFRAQFIKRAAESEEWRKYLP